MKRSLVIVLLSLVAARAADAGVLPEDRADVLLHSYDGGGVTIQGPSVLVRKQFAQKFSVSANHYVDRVSSASIDVITTASPYKEERTQQSVGLDYLHDRWMMNIGFTNSEENDYKAETFSFGLSQDIFGDLTTISLGYSLGNDTVGRRGDEKNAPSSTQAGGGSAKRPSTGPVTTSAPVSRCTRSSSSSQSASGSSSSSMKANQSAPPAARSAALRANGMPRRGSTAISSSR